VFCEVNSAVVSPVPASLYIRLVNLQSIPSEISLFTVEVELTGQKWIFPASWLKAVPVSSRIPLLWMNPPPELARRLTLNGPQLQPILKNGPLEPHKTIRGWMLFDFPSQYDSAVHPLMYRITVKDTAGHKTTAILSGPTERENVFPERGYNIDSVPINLNGRAVRHIADLFPELPLN
jgi:hypothetical protein